MDFHTVALPFHQMSLNSVFYAQTRDNVDIDVIESNHKKNVSNKQSIQSDNLSRWLNVCAKAYMRHTMIYGLNNSMQDNLSAGISDHTLRKNIISNKRLIIIPPISPWDSRAYYKKRVGISSSADTTNNT